MEVSGVKALNEPAVDLRQQRSGCGALAPALEEFENLGQESLRARP
jgi:hypothetical protein